MASRSTLCRWHDDGMRTTLPSGTPAEVALVDGARFGLVVIPDIWGLRPLFDDRVAAFADEWGASTVAIEPFGTEVVGTEAPERMAAVSRLDDSRVFRDLAEAADATGCASVGLIGFCMGGMYCFKAAATRRFRRIASFYGMITLPENWRSAGHREPLACLADGDASTVLAVIGGRDQWTPTADVDALRATGARVEYFPEADHGFAHDPSRPTHRADDAAAAFAAARDWLSAGA